MDNLYKNKNLELRSLAATVDVNTKTKDLYEQQDACIKKYKEKESLLIKSYELFEYDIDLIEAISLEELESRKIYRKNTKKYINGKSNFSRRTFWYRKVNRMEEYAFRTNNGNTS